MEANMRSRLTQAMQAAPAVRKDDITMNAHMDGSFVLMPGQSMHRPSEHDILGQFGPDDGMGLDFDLMPEVGRGADSMEIEVGRRQSLDQNFLPGSPILPLVDKTVQDDSMLGQQGLPEDPRDFSFNVDGDQSMQQLDVDFGNAGDLFGAEQPEASFQ